MGVTLRAEKMLILMAAVATLLAIAVAVLWYRSDASHHFWTDRDFSNYWIASRMILEGQVLDLFRGHDAYFAHMLRAFGSDYPWHSWSYPPHFLLMIWPLGLLPHGLAMIAFLLVSLFLYLHAVSVFYRRYRSFSALLIIPFVICNIWTAQNGFITAALFLYGMALRDRRPVLAGVAFGLLTVKPQLGLLIPILLLYERQWRVIASAGMTTIGLLALSGFVFGGEAWLGYVQNTWPMQTQVMNEGTGIFVGMMPSVFGALRLHGYDAAFAMTGHLVFALMILAGFVVSLGRMTSAEDRTASLIFATFLITPYSLVYDFGALVVVAGMIWGAGSWSFLRGFLVCIIAVMPLLYFPVVVLNVPFMPFVLLAGWCMLLAREPALSREAQCKARRANDSTASPASGMDSARRQA